ncbi:MAG: hypothetical protein WCJ97_03465 [Phycisphaerae bacterium]
MNPGYPVGPLPYLRLNDFQSLMRRWNTLHPYSAGQVMQISGPCLLPRWQQAITEIMSETGLGIPSVTPDGKTVFFAPVKQYDISECDDWLVESNRLLNIPFRSTEPCVRFFVCLGSDDSHYLGAIYDHWIADSYSMRLLMARVFAHYRRGEKDPSLPVLQLDHHQFWDIYARNLRWPRWIHSYSQGLKNMFRNRYNYRLHQEQPLNFHSTMLHRQLPDGLINRVHKFAKAQGASVNDAFVAALARAMGRLTASRRYTKRSRPWRRPRAAVGIGTIADIRKLSTEPMEHIFGLHLASFNHILNRPEATPITEVLRQTLAHSERVRTQNLTIKGASALALARRWWDRYSKPVHKAQILYKVVPTIGGLSNVNMTGSWVDPKQQDPTGPRVLDYLRISPTGPLLPLVFTLTTIGPRLSLCVTWRDTVLNNGVYSEADLRHVVDDFVVELEAMQ